MDSYQQFRQARYFESLDGLRAISILAVVWHHSSHWTGGGILSRGFLGVHLFFAISGILITTLLLRERDRHGKVSLKDFYVRRTLRIFPLYYAVILLYVIVVLLTERHTARGMQFFSNLPAYLTYTSNWFVPLPPGTSVIFHFAWSLATEEQFYLFWPSIVRFSRRSAVSAIAIALLLVASQLCQKGQSAGLISDSALWAVILGSIAAPICLGCLIAIGLHHRRCFAFIYKFAGQAWSAPLALILLVLALSRDTEYLVVAVLMACLVTTCVVRNDHPLRLLLANPVARHIGTISYGMYLLHMLCLNAVRKALGDDGNVVLRFACTAVLAIVVASLSYYLFERRFLRLKDKFSH